MNLLKLDILWKKIGPCWQQQQQKQKQFKSNILK
jgi:hypothetical protein